MLAVLYSILSAGVSRRISLLIKNRDFNRFNLKAKDGVQHAILGCIRIYFYSRLLLQQRKTFALAAEELYTSFILRDSYSQYSLVWVLMLLKIKFFGKNFFYTMEL